MIPLPSAPVIDLADHRHPCRSCRKPMHRMRAKYQQIWRCETCDEFLVIGNQRPRSRLLPALVLVLIVLCAIVLYSHLRGTP